jgi:UDP-N-acetylmuramoyl-L-alanyl-D-glutamate--2,6-diaminopimelate ligase
MRLKEFLEVEKVEEVRGNIEQPVTGLVYDSKAVREGHVFFAVPGTRVDGHQFAAPALSRGATAVVVERQVELPEGATSVRVRNVRRSMGNWASLFFARPTRHMMVIGVTGTNGKTTVTYLLESILSASGKVSGVIGTVNYRYQGRLFPSAMTTPESIELQAILAKMARSGVQSVAIEVSSHALVMERVRGIDFDVAVFTNLTRDHLDFHRDMDDYFIAKSRLFTDFLSASSKKRKIAVICADDPKGKELLDMARGAGLETWSYGRSREWDVHPLAIESDLEGLRGKIQAKDEEIDFSSRLVGAANVENILGAVAVGFALGLTPASIAEGVARLESVPGRLERVENNFGIVVLVDYAHTPDALEKVLQVVRALTLGGLIVLFGCGGDRDRGKRPLMGEIAARIADLVILTSDNPRSEEPLKILDEIESGVRKTGMKKWEPSGLNAAKIGAGKGYSIEPDRRAAIQLALRLAGPRDLVLIAGKGHEDYQILGSNRIHFDDREVAREELARRANT